MGNGDGLDGFNIAFAVRPETFVDVVDLLVPELQRRGRHKTEYAKATLRKKLFGRAGLVNNIRQHTIDGNKASPQWESRNRYELK